MDNLSHWDFAEQFSGYDAAALILGIEPRESAGDEHRVRVVSDRMELDYARAVQRARDENGPYFDERDRLVHLGARPGGLLLSVEMQKLWRDFYDDDAETPFSEWLYDRRQPKYENQVFNRASIVDWLKTIGMGSLYRFDLNRSNESRATSIESIDPDDLPDELYAANNAFRAVTHGHGDPLATFKNRLIGYLETNFPDLSDDAVKRIAIVANPNKAPGRRKSNAE